MRTGVFKDWYPNMPRTLARWLKINQSVTEYVCHVGGHTPQFLVNHIAKKIVNGNFLSLSLSLFILLHRRA